MLPTEILKNEHRVIERVLDVLDKIADRATLDRRVDETSAREVVDFLRNFADKCHHAKEEDRLFPAMQLKGFPGENGPIGVMCHEHELGRALVRKIDANIAEAANGDPVALDEFINSARAFSSLLRGHIEKEDFILYLMADQLFSTKDQDDLLESFEKAEHEHIGEGVHERYLGIADNLCNRYGVSLESQSAPNPCVLPCGHCCG